MTMLSSQLCDACRIGAPELNETELNQLSKEVPDWSLVNSDGIMQLMRSYKFKNFKDSLAFTNRIGEMAEEQNHHPEILTEWGKVTVTWWTHKIKGLHQNDFICAAKTDELV